MKRVIVLISCLLVGACSQPAWVKNGASIESTERTLTSCEADALRALPPNMITSISSTTATGNTNCKPGKHHGSRKKDKLVGTTYYNSRDANEGARTVLVRDCMYKGGWHEIKN